MKKCVRLKGVEVNQLRMLLSNEFHMDQEITSKLLAVLIYRHGFRSVDLTDKRIRQSPWVLIVFRELLQLEKRDERIVRLLKKNDIKRCPFCGCKGIYEKGDDYLSLNGGAVSVSVHRIYCDRCLVSPNTHWQMSKKRAKEIWNNRDGLSDIVRMERWRKKMKEFKQKKENE